MQIAALVALFTLFLFPFCPAQAAPANATPGQKCDQLGATQMSSDKNHIVVCLYKDTTQKELIWKSMSGSTPPTCAEQNKILHWDGSAWSCDNLFCPSQSFTVKAVDLNGWTGSGYIVVTRTLPSTFVGSSAGVTDTGCSVCYVGNTCTKTGWGTASGWCRDTCDNTN